MIVIVRPAPSRLNQTYIAFVTMIPANKVEIAKISQSQSLAARATFPKMIGQAPEWINPPESTSSALQKNAAAPKRNKWMHWLRSQHLLWSESMQGPYNSGISHGNDSLGQDWFTFCNRPTRSPTDKAYSLESVQKKLNLTFVRCVRCSFGWGTRIGENKKLSLTFVQCSFGWRTRIGENNKLSQTFVRCSFGWRIRIGENKKLRLTFVRCSFG